MTQILNERQQLARRLADEVSKMDGAFITSALPLDDQQRCLRMQILDSNRNRTIQAIRDLGFEPVFVSMLPRIHPMGVLPACIYEIPLPRAQQPVEDRTIRGELADEDRAAKKAARNAFLRELGYLKKNESA